MFFGGGCLAESFGGCNLVISDALIDFIDLTDLTE